MLHWLGDAARSEIPAIQSFATGLRQDASALDAALTTPWSNAQAEGQITRLKLVKRQAYGRARLDLLQRRILLASCVTRSAKEPRDRGNLSSTHGLTTQHTTTGRFAIPRGRPVANASR